jgi:uncharacterized membrane protein YadS
VSLCVFARFISSGAANKYGPEALQIATTVKLARALDHSVALITATVLKSSKIKIPYFIALFILAMILNTYVPQTAMVAPYLLAGKKQDLLLPCFNWSGIKSYRVKGCGFLTLGTRGFALGIIAIALLSILYFERSEFFLLLQVQSDDNHTQALLEAKR